MRPVLALLVASLVLPGIEAVAANGFSTKLQAVEKSRYKSTSFQGRKAERFELRSGDCNWADGGIRDSTDCKTGRERVERRSTTYDTLDQTVCYSYSLFLPSEYGEMERKSTLGQWHDRKFGDAISLRYMQGRMWLSQNIGDDEVKKVPIPFKKGEWNDFVFKIRAAHKDGTLQLWRNGKKLVDLDNTPTLPPSEKSWYFKYGIYRSHLKGVKNRPTQVAYYSNVSRFTGKKCELL